MTRDSQWADELRIAISATEASIALLDQIRAYVWENLTADDARPRELPAALEQLFQSAGTELTSAQGALRSAFRRYSVEPVETVVLRKPVSREQYFLLLAMGATRNELPVPDWLMNEPDPPLPSG